ncbi:monocarboxylate permease-like protein, mch4 [Nemania sp. NC0429]|nr:monocarboxylate permease-like protein, mch4 [Nemania sp. NC0429]
MASHVMEPSSLASENGNGNGYNNNNNNNNTTTTTNGNGNDSIPKSGTDTDPEKAASPVPAAGPPPPPNGGTVAWLQVAAGFVLFFNTWGILSSFGVFQSYYESGDLFTASSSNISWIGSIQSFLLQLTGLVAGPLYDRGYLRALLVTGMGLVLLGLFTLSASYEYYQALLSQGFAIGIGAGLLFTPTVSLLPTYFTTHIGLAIGIASSGSSLGGVIYPIVLSRLIDQVGFPWAVRAMGFIALGTFLLPLFAMRVRVQPPKPRSVVDWAAFTDVPFVIFTIGVFFVFIANTVVIFYISYYPLDRGFADQSLGFYIVAIFNAGSAFGRIIPNALSDRIGVFNTLVPLTLVLGVTQFALLGVFNTAGMVVEAIATGFFSGVVIALPPVAFRMLTTNKSMIGTRIGMGFALAGFGLLAAGPIAGAILASTSGPLNWTGVWSFGGATAIVSAICHTIVRIMRSGVALNVKA